MVWMVKWVECKTQGLGFKSQNVTYQIVFPEYLTIVKIHALFKLINSFGAIGDYSSRPSRRPVLSTLVNIMSCNDVIENISQYFQMSMKINID